MSSVSFKTAQHFIKIGFVTLLLLGSFAQAWEVDMSRRKLDFDRISDQNRLPASEQTVSSGFSVEQILPNLQPVHDIVILNTDKGFVPENVVVQKGDVYKIHLVNVNSDKKNISFIMDDFAESHSTPFAVDKEFEISPKKTGEYTFHCPETSYRGRLIVIDSQRKPASK